MKVSVGYHHFDWKYPVALIVLEDTEEALRRRRKRARRRRRMDILLLLLRRDLVAEPDPRSVESPCQSLRRSVRIFWQHFLAGIVAAEIQPESAALDFAHTKLERRGEERGG